MAINDALKIRLMKLLALAERGVGGEVPNARAALEAALSKNGLALEDLMDESRAMHEICWKSQIEKKLLVQIMATVCGAGVELFKSRSAPKKVLAKLTQREKVEIELLWTAHRRQLKKEMDLFYSAYLHRHELFPRDAEKRGDLTPEEERRMRRMAMMMMGMADVTVRKQLCSETCHV